MMNRELINISGISESRSVPIISDLVKEEGQSLIITASTARAEKLALDLSFFSNREIFVLPGEEQVFLKYSARNHDQLLKRLKVLKTMRTDPNAVVVAPVSAVIKRMMPHSIFENKNLSIKRGDEVDIEEIKENLVTMGYEREELVDSPGQFSVRGGIIDIYTPDGDYPYRIELFGEEVDSIRTFDSDTQRSVENLKFVEIYPAEQLVADKSAFDKAVVKIRKAYDKQIKKLESKEETLEAAQTLSVKKNELIEYIENLSNLQLLENYVHYFYDDQEFLWDYMLEGKIIIDDVKRIYEHLELRELEVTNDFQVMLERGQTVPEDGMLITGKKEFMEVYEQEKVYVLTPFFSRIEGIESLTEVRKINSRQMVTFNGKMDFFEDEVRNYLKKGYRVYIAASSKERAENLSEFVKMKKFGPDVAVLEGTLSTGFDFPDKKVCYISDSDIFSNYKPAKKRRKKTRGQQIKSFTDIKKGDYIVHEDYGIGKFEEILTRDFQGHKRDYIKIKYAGTEVLYVPVEQMDLIQKYIGSEGNAPKLSKLSGGEWKLTKMKAKAAIEEMAKELLAISAKRKIENGYAFSPDNEWQREFEDLFPYNETDDQLRSIAEIKADMEKPQPMDRLLCGDVGFGKTEVAARALFKCVSDGKQAAVLVPTTILANQHYHTMKERFEAFPFKVEMLSRFRSQSQQEKTIEDLKKGKVDLVVGTHRILSEDVKFKDLGLLVIDEEQRFGVAHKEKIKKLRSNVDVLTLSATPIPRTLNMSLTGIKDMSVIEEPPEERYPVQTYVLEQEDFVLREVINRELDRGGQVYVVYNRVRGINKLAEKISSLVPEAKVIVGHGQMNEHALEDVMVSFIEGEYNVLVATTIIESGIDIPNANTMIVIDSDKYGLSQLYQLRGRVGRSNRIAYAYLMYQKDKILSEVAEKRLKAVKEFTEFGSGFKIAMRDLEIRGAGNILGSQQSGHMMNIGYEMYCKLVDEAIKTAQGQVVPKKQTPMSVEIKVNAHIPSWYIENEMLKLQMYKKIADIETTEDADEVMDEVLDRFGDLPQETMNLITVSKIRAMGANFPLEKIMEQGKYISFIFNEEYGISEYTANQINFKFLNRAEARGGKNPFIRLAVTQATKLDDIIKVLEIMRDTKAENQLS